MLYQKKDHSTEARGFPHAFRRCRREAGKTQRAGDFLTLQGVVFAIGAIRGPQFTPYSFIFKRVVKPRLRGEVVTEDSRPPQFSMGVGLVFALVGLLGSAIGSAALFNVAVGFALAASFLNSVFNYCLGCQMYLLVLRVRKRSI